MTIRKGRKGIGSRIRTLKNDAGRASTERASLKKIYLREESARGITLNPFSDRVIETSGFLKQGIVGQLVFLQREFINCRCDFCRKDIYSENVVLDQALLSLEMRQDRDISNLSDPSV